MNLELTPIMVDGIEIYTNPEKTVSGMSISGLARLVGVDRATMSRLNLQVLEEQYKNDNYALKVLSSGLFTPKLEAPNKAKIIKSEVCLLIIKYYAFGTSKVSNKIKNKCKELLKDNIKIKDFILQSYLQDEFKEIHEKAIKYEEMESLGLSKQVLCFKNNLVSLYEGNPVVDTLELATVFEKRHDIVLRDIHSKLSTSQNPKILDFYKKHIIKTFYYDTYSREQTKYLLTREGFSLIALGFTGEKAELFKIKYIEAFEEMYEKLRGYALATYLGRTENKQLVYVIKNSITGLIKIGITNNLKRRLNQLECATGCELEVVFCSPVSDNSKDLEKYLHTRFSDFRCRGEWFDVSSDLVVNAITQLDFVLD